jgi:nicotinamide riboside kinase
VTIDKLAEARARAALEGRAAPRMEDLAWTTRDFLAIARGQAELEQRAATQGGPVIVCDTDAFVTGVWHERYVGQRSPEVEALAVAARRHLYLLTDPADVPFIQDGLRDGERTRAWMTETFVRRLEATGRAWRWLRGARAERLAHAEVAVDALVAEGLRLAAPLG